MRARNIFSAAILTFLTVSVSAQTKPDFSGHWTTDPEPGTATQSPTGQGSGSQRAAPRAGDLGTGWGPKMNITINQDAGRLTVVYPYFSIYDMQPPLRFHYALDGSETKNSFMMGRGLQAQISKAAWDGDKLVITTVHNTENPTNGQPLKIEMKQVLWLESPASLIVETTRNGVLGGPPSTARTVYRKVTARAGGT